MENMLTGQSSNYLFFQKIIKIKYPPSVKIKTFLEIFPANRAILLTLFHFHSFNFLELNSI